MTPPPTMDYVNFVQGDVSTSYTTSTVGYNTGAALYNEVNKELNVPVSMVNTDLILHYRCNSEFKWIIKCFTGKNTQAYLISDLLPSYRNTYSVVDTV